MPARLTDLVHRAWPWVPLALLAVALIVVLAAFAVQPSVQDDDRVRYTFEDFVDAAGNRDASAACALLTAQGQRALTAAVPGVSCETYARSFGFDVSGLGGVTLNLPRKLPDTVVLDRTNMVAADGTPVLRSLQLVRVGDDYRIASLTR